MSCVLSYIFNTEDEDPCGPLCVPFLRLPELWVIPLGNICIQCWLTEGFVKVSNPPWWGEGGSSHNNTFWPAPPPPRLLKQWAPEVVVSMVTRHGNANSGAEEASFGWSWSRVRCPEGLWRFWSRSGSKRWAAAAAPPPPPCLYFSLSLSVSISLSGWYSIGFIKWDHCLKSIFMNLHETWRSFRRHVCFAAVIVK